MANILPTPVKQRIQASGGPPPIALVELLTVAGALNFWADTSVTAPTVLYAAAQVGGLTPVTPPPTNGGDQSDSIVTIASFGPAQGNFLPWIVKPPTITQFKSTQTATFNFSIQNLTGDTIRRDASQIFSQQELYGALVYIRLWRMDCEYSLRDFQGTVTKAVLQVDGETMDISGEGAFNWAKCPAPTVQIGSSCGNNFNDIGAFSECGAFAGATPCNNSYGTCQQLNRFKGIITEWSGQTIDYSQLAQPIPLRPYNPVGKV